jgi:hypothetical protein
MRTLLCSVCGAILTPADMTGAQRCWDCGCATATDGATSQAPPVANRSHSPDLQRVQRRAENDREVRSGWPMPTSEMVRSKVRHLFPQQESQVIALLDTVG